MAENIISQAANAVPEIQKPGVGPKFTIPNKVRAIVVVSILILIAGVGVAIYQNQKVQVKTTGAIAQPVTYAPNDPYVELNKLLDRGDFSGDGFQVKNVSRSTKVAVFLDKPYDQNQTKFEAWLKANGYGEIPQDKIVYFHNP